MMNNIQFNFSNADISIKETVYVYHKTREKDFILRHTNRNCYSFALILSGQAQYNYGNKQIIAKEGDLLFLKKGETYTTHVTDEKGWEHIVISFNVWDEENIKKFSFKTVNRPKRFKRFEDLFKLAFESFENANSAGKLQCKSIIYQIFALLLEEGEKQFFKKSKYEGIKDAVYYIESNYKDKISVNTLANLSGYSISHFGRIFKEIYGVSPNDFINSFRIEKAKKMLRTEMFSLSEIAEECGFSNVYYFSRIFKQLTGITPKKY